MHAATQTIEHQHTTPTLSSTSCSPVFSLCACMGRLNEWLHERRDYTQQLTLFVILNLEHKREVETL